MLIEHSIFCKYNESFRNTLTNADDNNHSLPFSKPKNHLFMPPKFLTALPVFNEVKYGNEVLDLVKKYSPQVLVVDDGSTDGTT